MCPFECLSTKYVVEGVAAPMECGDSWTLALVSNTLQYSRSGGRFSWMHLSSFPCRLEAAELTSLVPHSQREEKFVWQGD